MPFAAPQPLAFLAIARDLASHESSRHWQLTRKQAQPYSQEQKEPVEAAEQLPLAEGQHAPPVKPEQQPRQAAQPEQPEEPAPQPPEASEPQAH